MRNKEQQPAFTVEKQIENLHQLGLTIDNDEDAYNEYYDTVRDLMIILHEGFGIGNVTA